MTVYTAFAAFRTGGVYTADDFLVTGVQPTWRAINSGLTNTLVHMFRADPFVPLQRQYLMLTNKEIYARNTAVGDGWTKIMDEPALEGLLGVTTGTLYWLAPDQVVSGRLYVTYGVNSYFGHSFMGRSDDYGQTWVTVDVGGFGRGLREVEAYGNIVWAHAPHPWIAPKNKIFYSSDGGASWSRTDGVTIGGDASLQLMVAPDLASAYIADSGTDIRKIVAADITTVYTGVKQQDSLNLTSNALSHSAGTLWAIDMLWINPEDGLHQRILDGKKLYVTHDAWATVDNPTPTDLDLTGTFSDNKANCLTTPNDNIAVPVFISVSSNEGLVYALADETGVTVENRSGTNWATPPYTDAIPDTVGSASLFGLWVGRISQKDIFVYAVEMSGPGVERAVPLAGDRSAWRVDDYPEEHAEDLFNLTPTRHAPVPGASGEVPRSNGSVWQSTRLSLSDLGLSSTLPGQVLMSLDGLTYSVALPITDPEVGWLVDGETGLMIVDGGFDGDA